MTTEEENGMKVSLRAYFDEKLQALRLYFDTKIDAIEKKNDATFTAAKEAVATALAAAKEAVAAALAAAKEAVAAALSAQERALVLAKKEADAATQKLGDALATYKASQNEWQKTFSDYRASIKEDTLSKGETLAMFDKHLGLIQKLEIEVNKIQNALSRGEGGTQATASGKQQSNWMIALLIGVAFNALGLIAAVIFFVVGK